MMVREQRSRLYDNSYYTSQLLLLLLLLLVTKQSKPV